MLDPELLAILVCPETREPVHLADAALLDRINQAVSAGELRTRSGELLKDQIQAGLVREDGLVLYPVKDDIPVMLIDEAIPLEGLG
jgi:uncharacterized protein YbaR (Trm112 family)